MGADYRGKDIDAFAYASALDALGLGDTSKAAFEQAAEIDLLNQLAATDEASEEVLSSIVAAAPSGTPLGRLSDEDLLEQYKSAVVDLRAAYNAPRGVRAVGAYTREGQDIRDEAFEFISDAKKEVAKYVDEINARGLDFPKEDTPYGGKVGTVIGPQGSTTTVVLGDEAPNIPGTDTTIYTGSYEIPGSIIVDTGVSTGIPVLDDIIKAGTGQEVGGKVTITDVGLEEIARRTGIPVDDILEALEDSGVFGPPAPPGAQTPTQTQTGGAATQTGGTEEDTEGAGPFSAPVLVSTGGLGVTDIIEKLKDIFSGDGGDTVSTTGGDSDIDTTTTNGGATTDITTTTGGDSDIDTTTTGGDSDIDTITTGGGSDIDTIATGGGSDIDTIATGGGSDIDTIATGGGASDVISTGGGGTPIETASTIQTGGGGITSGMDLGAQQTGGIEGMSREQVGVADVRSPFDRSASLAENLRRILSQTNKNNKDSNTNKITRTLRG